MTLCCEQICIGGSTVGLVIYWLTRVKCICKNPCDCNNNLCIYKNIDDNELIIITDNKDKNKCCF